MSSKNCFGYNEIDIEMTIICKEYSYVSITIYSFFNLDCFAKGGL